MAYRCVFLFLAVVLVSQTASVKQDKNKHPGTIVDAVTGRGIQAGAYAYGSPGLTGDGNCPTYSVPLHSTHSQEGTGSFTFEIEKARSSYIAAYCQNGYASRTEDKNDNSEDGTRVQPDPISLFPKQAQLASLQIDPVDASFVAIARVIDRAQSDLLYLSRADKDLYKAALERFTEGDQRILMLLRERQSIGVLLNPKPFPRGKR